jgi:choline dehydrogenase-like flavoprotein
VIEDARSLAAGSEIECDVCVAGAGPAGITLAREMSGKGLRVCLVESGGLDFDSRAQALARLAGVDGDLAPSSETRRIQFGGTANAWDVSSGAVRRRVRYRPLSEIDFLPRPWVPLSGWPFPRAHLDPFYSRAQRACGISAATFRPADWETGRAQRLPLDEKRVTTAIEQFGESEVFTSRAREELSRTPDVRVLVHASVCGLRTAPTSGVVEGFEIGCLGGRRHTVRARHFVLASGAIENARLLLQPLPGRPRGVGNGSDLVGRCLMDHHYVLGGWLVPADRTLFSRAALYDLRRVHGAWGMGKLRLADELLQSERLLNAAARIVPDTGDRQIRALRSFKQLVTLTPWWKLPTRLASGVRALPSARYVVSTALPLVFRQGRLRPNMTYGWSDLDADAAGFAGFEVELQVELAPDPANRVRLAAELDPLGRPRARICWRWGELDLLSLRRTQELLATELERAGLGRLATPDPVRRPEVTRPAGAHHPSGTTRMHRDPSFGVVDPDGRVHGMENLFVAGSSVFPTSGYANPTLTIIALTIRLADHLKRRLGVRTP